MNDEDAFIRAIQAAPNDAAPNLVYADWLEEQGQPLRAEYLRLMVEVAKPPTKSLEDEQRRRRFAELGYSHTGSTWRSLIAGETRLEWNATTSYALSRLQGFLDACALFNNHASDISYEFDVALLSKISSLEEAVSAHYLSWAGPTRCDPIENMSVTLLQILEQWLFQSYPMGAHWANNVGHLRLGVTSEDGRSGLVTHVRSLVDEVLTPIRCWRVQFLGNQRMGIDWLSVALESVDRVLILHFDFDD
jgi:uncharacterized protein (TIGR02996 family)